MNELQRSIDTDGFVFLENVAFIIWKWDWIDDNFKGGIESSTMSDIQVIPETPPQIDSDDESKLADGAMALDLCSQMTHTVTFKCIGTTKETQYQERLKQIAQLRDRGLQVSCRLKPEPDKPFDSNAIAFKCQIDGTWQVIGYIVREAVNEVHEDLAANKVIKVALDWVKFQLQWRSVGWYAGVNISHSGQWSHTVIHCQSSRH